MMDLLGGWLGWRTELGKSELGEETDGSLLQVAGQAGPGIIKVEVQSSKSL